MLDLFYMERIESLTLRTTCVSSSWSGPRTRGPRGWAWCGISSSSPVCFGFGSDLKSPSAMEVIVVD